MLELIQIQKKTIQGLIDLRTKDRLDFILHPGDLSYANNYNPGGPVWDHYGDILEPLVAFTPYCPSVGNHESINNFTAYRYRYGTTQLEQNSVGGDFYWSFDWGNVHVIHLSSETDFFPNSTQFAWLQNDLQNINRKLTPWVIASWHRPWYNSNTAHSGDGEDMRKSFETLFTHYKVDLALVGHVHAYERIAEVVDGKITTGGTAYITIGNGGTPEGLASKWKEQPVWSQFRLAKWGYSQLHVYNATHAHWTMRDDSTEGILDEYWFIKTR